MPIGNLPKARPDRAHPARPEPVEGPRNYHRDANLTDNTNGLYLEN